MVRQTTRVIILEILAGFGILSMLAMGALALRLAAGPLELGFFKDDIEAALVRMRDGRAVSLDQVSLEWLADENRAVIVADNLQLFDEAGMRAGHAARAEILVDTAGLLLGDVRPISVTLETGEIEVHRGEDGWTIAGDPIGSAVEAPEDAETLSAEDVLGLANEGLVDLLALLDRDAAGFPLQTIRFEGFDLVVTETDIGERARLGDASGSLRRNAGGIQIIVSGANETGGDGAPGGFAVAISAPGDYSRIDAELTMTDWSLAAASQIVARDADWVSGLPADVSLTFGVNGEVGLEDVALAVQAGAGTVRLGGSVQPVSVLELTGVYVPGTDRLTAEFTDFGIGPARGAMTLVLDGVLARENIRGFSLQGPRLDLDLRERFAEAWPLRRVNASGSLALDPLRVDFDTLGFRTYGAMVRANGTVEVVADRQPGELPVATDLAIELTGVLSPDELLTFWPVKAAPGARQYILRNVQTGQITGATAQVALARDSVTGRRLDDDAVNVRFEAIDAAIKPLPDLPAVTDTSLVGYVTGNSVKIDFAGGRFGQWDLGTGQVHYPQLSPSGADMTVRVSGSGPAKNLVQIVSDSRLQLQARSGFDPATVSGDADMSFTLVRPASANIPFSAFRYTGTGTVKNGGLEDAFGGQSLTDSDADVMVDEKGMTIAGFGVFGASPLEYKWSYKFGVPNAPSELSATSVIDPDILNAFGIVGRAYLAGEVPAELQARFDGAGLNRLDAAFDLQTARLDVAELGWIKPAGKPATATVQYTVDDGVPTTAATLNADDAAFDGSFALEPDGRLISAKIERAFLKDRLDLQGTARRGDNQELVFDLDAEFLDLTRLVGNMTEFGDPSSAAGQIGDVTVDVRADRLLLREGFDISDNTLSLVSNHEGLQTLSIIGKLPNGADISAAYDASGLRDPSFLINSGDAGFVANVFLETDALENGTLDISGTLATGELPTQIRVVIEDGRLKDAPFVTQVLSLASLRGLSDTLSGDGVLFSRIEIPITLLNGRYNIVGASASGPALGLTANGWIMPADGGIDIDGVLVPSFGLNSALGGLPLIGDLFVSREGEGVISLRYGIEGTLERAQVSVNPLSAVTPGVLRRIFESPAEEPLPPADTPPEEDVPRPDE